MFTNLKQMGLGSILGVLIILVVLPLGALYYMNQGLKWRKERLSELKPYSYLSEDQLSHAYDSLPGFFLNENNILVTSFVNPDNDELTPLFGQALRKLHEQFDARGDVFFVTHILNTPNLEKDFVISFRKEYALEDTSQCVFLLLEEDTFQALAREAYQIEREKGDEWRNNAYFELVDSMVVRSYYNVRTMPSIQRLVEHIAILIPPAKEREDLVFKREKEK